MGWVETYNREDKPEMEAIGRYVDSPLWQELCSFLEETYAVKPSIEYSVCSGAPGWNVKYKKSGKALCTMYPNQGYFTCLVSIGRKEATEAELLLTSFGTYMQELYQNTNVFNGGRWLMIDVSSPQICAETKELICLRVRPRFKAKAT